MSLTGLLSSQTQRYLEWFGVTVSRAIRRNGLLHHRRVGIAARIWLQIVTQPDFRAEAKQQICLAFDPSRTVLSDAETEKAVSVQML